MTMKITKNLKNEDEKYEKKKETREAEGKRFGKTFSGSEKLIGNVSDIRVKLSKTKNKKSSLTQFEKITKKEDSNIKKKEKYFYF